MNLRQLANYLFGWRLFSVVGAIAGAALLLAVGTDLGPGELTIAVFAALVIAAAFLVVMARLGILGEARHDRVTARLGHLERKLGAGAGSVADLNARVNKIDEVLADSVRRPTDPTTLPWTAPDDSPILLLPSAAYHLAEIMPLSAALNRRGYPTRVAVGTAHWPRLATGLGWYDSPIYALPEPDEAINGIRAVITMKDWAGYGEVVSAAKAAGIPTFAKVEGAQDFGDADTPYARAAYRSADHILCQGQNDFDALEGSRYIVGSSRLERLRHAPLLPTDQDHVVINLNFTYGVLEAQRATWIESAVAACEQLSLPYTVAMHPAERRTRTVPHASTVPISRLLLRASVLVSRFSTVPFEAMARGVPFIYHNPHGETVATFAHGGDAFRKTETTEELVAALEEAQTWGEDYRDRSAAFFKRQVDINPEVPSEERTADVVFGLLG